MLLTQELALMEIFAANAAAARRELRFYEQTEHDLDRRTVQERREKEERELIEQVLLASTEQIDAFRHQLDRYDTAVVDALTDNERNLDQNRRRQEEMDAKAYRLPDGRVVFKSDDGQHVLDRKGAAVSDDLISPESVPDALPRWEQRDALNREEQRLTQEREQIHAYQTKLDHARDTIDKGGVTTKQLDALDADLQAAMPDAVKKKAGLQSPALDADGPGSTTPAQANALRGAGETQPSRQTVPGPGLR